MQIKKQDIYTLPLQQLATKNMEEVHIWSEQHELSHHHTWLLPQAVANFGGWTLVKVDNKPDVLQTLKHNIGSDPWQQGLWKLSRIRRSSLITSQVKAPEYGAFTPLILMGFKRMQGVPYEAWRGLEGLEYILEPDIYSAVVLDDYTGCNLGSARLLELRAQGLLVRSGAKLGTSKSPESTWSLTGLKSTELGGFPKLTQTMLCQCWLAHPKHRTPYMILDPQNWDVMPPPLVDSELFSRPEPKVEKTKAKFEYDPTELPW